MHQNESKISAVAEISTIDTPDYSIPLYHFSKTPGIPNDLTAFVKREILGSFKKNSYLISSNQDKSEVESKTVPHNQAMGYGFYLSSDPFESAHIGNLLVVTHLKPKTRLVKYGYVTLETKMGPSWRAAMSSPQIGVMHSWDSGLATGLFSFQAKALLIKEVVPEQYESIELSPDKTFAVRLDDPTKSLSTLPVYKPEEYRLSNGNFNVARYFSNYAFLLRGIAHRSTFMSLYTTEFKPGTVFEPWRDEAGELKESFVDDFYNNLKLTKGSNDKAALNYFFDATRDFLTWNQMKGYPSLFQE